MSVASQYMRQERQEKSKDDTIAQTIYNSPTAQHAKKIAPSATTFDLVMRVAEKDRLCAFVLERLQR